MTEYRIDRFVRDSLYIKEKRVGGVTCNAALLDTCKYDIDVSRFRHACMEMCLEYGGSNLSFMKCFDDVYITYQHVY